MRRGVLVLVAFCGLSLPAIALAEPTPEERTRLEEARERYRRQPFCDGGDYACARVELERAYQLAPHYKILYNLGLVYEQLGDYVQAQSTLERYLAEGGDAITPERRAEVEKTLAQLRGRTARLAITLDVDDVQVLVDDACPVDAATRATNCGSSGRRRDLLVNPGRRRVSFAHAAYQLEQRNVTFTSGQEHRINVHGPPIATAERETNPFVAAMWVTWSIGAVTLASAIVASVAGARAQQAEPSLTRATVALGVGSSIALAAATYFTVRVLTWKPGRSVSIAVAPTGFLGRF